MMDKITIWNDNEIEDYAAQYIEDGYDAETAYDAALMDMECLFNELQNKLELVDGEYVVYGKLVRWTGEGEAWKYISKHSLKNAVLDIYQDDSTNKFYVDGRDLFWSYTGHDNPVNPAIMRIRRVKDGLCEDDFYENSYSRFDDMTEPVGLAVRTVFGIA